MAYDHSERHTFLNNMEMGNEFQSAYHLLLVIKYFPLYFSDMHLGPRPAQEVPTFVCINEISTFLSEGAVPKNTEREQQVLSMLSFTVFLPCLLFRLWWAGFITIQWFYPKVHLYEISKVVWFVLSCEGLTADAGILISPV